MFLALEGWRILSASPWKTIIGTGRLSSPATRFRCPGALLMDLSHGANSERGLLLNLERYGEVGPD